MTSMSVLKMPHRGAAHQDPEATAGVQEARLPRPRRWPVPSGRALGGAEAGPAQETAQLPRLLWPLLVRPGGRQRALVNLGLPKPQQGLAVQTGSMARASPDAWASMRQQLGWPPAGGCLGSAARRDKG